MNIRNLIKEKSAFVAERKSLEYGYAVVVDRSLLPIDHTFYSKTNNRFVGFDHRNHNGKKTEIGSVFIFETLEKAKSSLGINNN